MSDSPNLINYLPSETLIITPNGVAILKQALKLYEDQIAEPWDIGLVHTIMNNLNQLKMPN